jgi:cation diffusion facilitator CzcD-associated flavoprotein CzcO
MTIKVGIIGAGVSGLATAKAFRSQGHAVTLIEKIGALGGVWAPERRYLGLHIQITRDCYSLSDFPMPAHYPQFPSSAQMYDYLQAYADRFGLRERILFNTEVVRILTRPDGRNGWRMEVRDTRTGATRALDFDFVVVCNGLFSIPNIPDIPGREHFEAAGGRVLHSSQVRIDDALKDRAVVVVGFGKSAIDMAEAALSRARSVAMVCRHVHWKFPRRLFGRANIMRLVLSRFTELWFRRDDMGWGHRLLHGPLRPLVNVYWRLSERVIARQVGLRGSRLRPDMPLRLASVCIGLAPPDGFKALQDGRIALHRASIVRLHASGLDLDNGDTVEADTIILATGYRQECAFLDAAQKKALFDASGAIQLYRSLINPDIPFMAFNGYNGVGACQLTAEVGACWLVRFAEGGILLPDRDAMYDSIRSELEMRARLVASRLTQGYYVSPFTFGYLDQLLADLGLPPADSHRRLFDWLFAPLEPRDYQNLLARSKAARPDRAIAL